MKNHPYKSQLSWIRLIKVDNLYVLENKIVITDVFCSIILFYYYHLAHFTTSVNQEIKMK